MRRAKLSITRTHSATGIALILAVIAAFKSMIVWGLFFIDVVLQIAPEIEIWGVKVRGMWGPLGVTSSADQLIWKVLSQPS